ncbi:MAG: hypothetical protein J7L15_07750, partial [Clostridiales bacterium]|nr:hypothetical protein [Clostridiales bacterium]
PKLIKKIMENKYNSAIGNIIKKVKGFNRAEVSVDLEKLNINLKISSKELRFVYFNVVSILTLKDYLDTLDTIQAVQDLEQEMVLGNTILPLIKVEASGKTPIEFIHIRVDTKPSHLPIFGLKIAKTKDHFSFYMLFMSSLKTEVKYLNVQMRTSGNQYKVDGQSYINLSQYNKKMNTSHKK